MAENPLNWRRCMDQEERPAWCLLDRLDTSTITATQGVYIIWHGGDEPDTLRVGQAYFQPIADVLDRHRDDSEINAFKEHGLYVTWAEVAEPELLDGIERYLGDTLQPLLGKRPSADPVAVNLPWGD